MTRSLVLTAPRTFEAVDFDLPTVSEDDALLEVELAGICGTDWKTYLGKLPYRLPLVLGHEIVGRLARIGDRMADRTGLRAGDRVSVGGTVPCWSCEQCQTGNARFCRRPHGYGTLTPSSTPPHLWGAFGEHLYVAPGAVLHRLDDDLPGEAAVCAQAIVANGFAWVQHQGEVRAGDVVVVQGAGPQGIGCALVAREAGAAQVVLTGLTRDAERLEIARRLGAHVTIDVERENAVEVVRDMTGGRMADLVVDVTGAPASLVPSIRMVRQQGTVVVAGLVGQHVGVELPLDEIVWNEIRLQGAFIKNADAARRGIDLVHSRRWPLEDIVTHSWPLARAEEALLAIGGETSGVYPVKAVVRPR